MPKVDLSQIPPAVKRHYIEVGVCAAQQDFRGVANAALKYISKAPSPDAYGRYYIFEYYVRVLVSKPKIMNESDKDAFQKILSNKKEPALFRSRAAYMLGYMGFGGDREEAADYFRQVLEIAQNISEEEAGRPIMNMPYDRDDLPFGEKGYSTVGREAKKWTESAKNNLQKLTDPYNRRGDPESSQYVDQDVPTSDRLRFSRPPPSDLPPEVQKRALELGGDACDCCGKTLEQLGVARLKCCGRCKSAYYCGPDCQSKQWKAGHSNACRQQGDVKPSDWMKLQGMPERLECLNETIVKVLSADPTNPGKWVVRMYRTDLKDEDKVKKGLPTSMLAHIRPEK